MEQLTRSATEKFIDLLPNDKKFFTPDDLREYEIPEFIVQRIEIEIYQNLNESILPPHSEWADMSASGVEHAWEQFIEAIVAEVRMPASFAPSVFETSIADVVELILHPRTAIPSVLFGPDTRLDVEEIEKRTRYVTVNSHLSTALLKYMERRNKSELDLETCRRIITQVDERLTSNYNSLSWAQLLQPLFILSGPKVDTEFFRLFFEDRGMLNIARKFDLLNGSLNKTEFIEVMSAPDLLNDEGEDEEQASLFTGEIKPKEAEPEVEEDESERISETEEPEAFDEPEEEVTVDDVQKKEHQHKESEPEPEPKADEEDDEQTEEDTLLNSFQLGLRSEEEDEETDDIEKLGKSEDQRSIDTDKFLYGEEADDEEDEEADEPLYSRFGSSDDENEDEAERFAEQFLMDDDQSDDDFKVNFDNDDQPESKDGLKTKSDSENDDPLKEKPEEVLPKPEKKEKRLVDSFEELEDEDEDEIWGVSEDEDVTEDEVVGKVKPDSHEDEEADEDEDEGSDRPIWQSFLGEDGAVSEDDIPEHSDFSDLAGEFEEDEAAETLNQTAEPEEERVRYPQIDLRQRDEPEEDPESVKLLIGWMQHDEKRFTSSIFGGSEAAYDQALIKLDGLRDWKEASYFIEKDIFARNKVDMYDEDAVDFTDRLQAYFKKFKSK